MKTKLTYKEYGTGEPLYFIHGMRNTQLTFDLNSSDDIFNVVKKFILLEVIFV